MKALRYSYLVFALFLGAAAHLHGKEQAKPNLIIVLIDDMGYSDIAPFGSQISRTPNLDRMAAEGMKMTSFYANPKCTPSRAQILTGCIAKRVGMPVVIWPNCPTGLNPQENTVADLLKAQGYATMAIGKWHLGDQQEFLPTRHGFDSYYGLPYSNDMGPDNPDPEHRTLVQSGRYPQSPPLPLLQQNRVVEAPADQDSLTERFTGKALQFIRENKDKPFFLYFAHIAVHRPLHPGPSFKGKSPHGLFSDWVEELDASTGRILDTLRELGLEKNTLVLFTSDNGPWLQLKEQGGKAFPLRGGKGTTWEGGMREPTIAWWPGRIAPGTVCDAIASELDVLPTFVGLAGGTVPADRKIDGQDIWPLLSGQTKESPHEVLYYYSGNRLQALRSGPWKLAITPQNIREDSTAPVPPMKPLLYNLDRDIGETTDVAGQNPEIVARLLKFVDKIDADLGKDGTGPGVRPPGRVEKTEPLLLRIGAEYD